MSAQEIFVKFMMTRSSFIKCFMPRKRGLVYMYHLNTSWISHFLKSLHIIKKISTKIPSTSLQENCKILPCKNNIVCSRYQYCKLISLITCTYTSIDV